MGTRSRARRVIRGPSARATSSQLTRGGRPERSIGLPPPDCSAPTGRIRARGSPINLDRQKMTSNDEKLNHPVSVKGMDIKGDIASSDRQVIRSEHQGNILKEIENQSFSGNHLPNFASQPAGPHRATRAITTGSNMKVVLDMFKYDYYEGLLSTESGSDECRAGGKVEKEVIQKGCLILRNAGLRQG